MAFNALTPAEVAPDQPLSTTLLDKVRTNFDDHEARIQTSGGAVGEVLNGSFETPQGGNPNWPDKWAIGQYAGGQVLLDRDVDAVTAVVTSVSGSWGAMPNRIASSASISFAAANRRFGIPIGVRNGCGPGTISSRSHAAISCSKRYTPSRFAADCHAIAHRVLVIVLWS